MDYQLHSAVYKEGEPATHIYIVNKGDFVLKKIVKGVRKQNEIVILGPGEITGDEDAEMYTKSCICTSAEG